MEVTNTEKKEKISPKLRVTTLTKKLGVIKDRLVDQYIELNNGPTFTHGGPVRLEFTLAYNDDVQLIMGYLERLSGKVPLKERKVYKKETVDTYAAMVEELLADVRKLIADDKIKTQDALISYLRDKGFVFLSYQTLKDIEIETIGKVGKEYQDKAFLIRRIKEAKSTKADKYDPQLMFIFQLFGKKTSKVIPILYGDILEPISIKWKESYKVNFKKLEFTIFPHYMTLEEREKYRVEQRKYKLDPEAKFSKFYLRWNPVVEKLNRKKQKKG